MSNTVIHWPEKMSHLRTDRLILRPFGRSDAEVVSTLAGDPRVALKTENIPFPYSSEQASCWIEQQEELFRRHELLVYAVSLLDANQEPIGCVSLQVTDFQGRAELGYWIGYRYWNSGYCTEAASEVVRFAFQQLHCRKLTSGHLRHNEASKKVLTRIGFRLEGIRLRHIVRDGQEQDLLIYGLHYDEYANDNA